MTAIGEPSGEERDEHTGSVIRSKEWISIHNQGVKDKGRCNTQKGMPTPNPTEVRKADSL